MPRASGAPDKHVWDNRETGLRRRDAFHSPASRTAVTRRDPMWGEHMSELLEVRTGPLVTLTMNRPDSLNALSSGLIGGMIEAFDRLGRDVDVGAILLTGAGRSFCVGGDVKAMAGRKDRSYEERVQDLRWKQR